MNTTDKAFGKFPWNYTESFIFLFILFVSGIFLEIFTNHIAPVIPASPFSYLAGGAYLLLLLIVYPIFKKHPLIVWLSGPAASFSAMFGMLILLAGMILIPQKQSVQGLAEMTGATHIRSTWTYLIIFLYLLTNLGMVTLRRLWPFKGKNIGFFLTHCGLWVLLAALFLSTGDVKKLSVNLLKNGEGNNIGISQQGMMDQLPFNLRLIDFKLDEYAPKLALYSNKDSLEQKPLKIIFPNVKDDLRTMVGPWKIQIQDYLPGAIPVDSINYMSSGVAGSCPAALLEAVNVQSGDTVTCWIASGSYYQPAVYITLGNTGKLGLTAPEPENFSSRVLFSDSTKTDTLTLSLNKSFTNKYWNIYQMNYDKNKGKWSTLSVLEAVYDPWQPFLEAGIILFLSGFIYLLFFNLFIKNEP